MLRQRVFHKSMSILTSVSSDILATQPHQHASHFSMTPQLSGELLFRYTNFDFSAER